MTTDPSTIDPHTLARAEQLARDRGCTVDTLLVDAMFALEDIEQRKLELQAEVGRRVALAGTELSQPLDRAAFHAEALRRRLKESSP